MMMTPEQTAVSVGVAADGSLVTLHNEQGEGWVVTAQHLMEGDALYLVGAPEQDAGWGRDVRAARFFEDKAEAEAAAQTAATRPDLLIGPYLFAARRGDNGPWPATYREAIRAQGPTFGPRFSKHLAQHPRR